MRRFPNSPVARVATVVVVAWLAFQLPGTTGTTPSGRVLNQLERAVKTPLPGVPAPKVSRPDQLWVPDRYVVRPDGVILHVPAHWERSISSTEVYAPPLIACPLVGQCVLVPAGTRLPAHVRPGP